MPALFAAAEAEWWQTLLNHCVIGLTGGSLYALIALGYTMVYGIIGLINFAHGDLFMLGGCLTLALIGALGLSDGGSAWAATGGIALALLVVPCFCGAINVAIDRLVYRPLRGAPRLAPLVSAIGVSFVLQNLGAYWIGTVDRSFPALVSNENLLENSPVEWLRPIQVSWVNVLVIAFTLPTMLALTAFVKLTRLGTAMRATEQNTLAAQLMGVPVHLVVAITFAIGGALAGVASVVYAMYVGTVSFQMGYTNGLFAFTAAVLGGIGNLPGAVLGGLVIGLVRSLGGHYLGESWNTALIFGILIVILVFRPGGLLGASQREKV